MKALFWDNDGVLVETEPLFFRATREVLADEGISLDRADYVEISLRRGRSCLDLAEGRGASRDRIEELRRVRNVRYAELIAQGVAVLDGVERALSALHGRVPMAVVTSSNRDHFDQIHEQTGLRRYFDFVLANGDYVRHKPHPEPYLTAAARLGVDPGECVAVEDTERGLESASRAGMRCLAVPGSLSSGGDFSRAHRVLDGVGEIPGIVDAWLRTGAAPARIP